MTTECRLTVLSLAEIERGISHRLPHVVISIASPRQPKPAIPDSSLCHGVLYLRFHDAEPSSIFVHPPEIKFMTSRHASQIWSFVGRHIAKIGHIVVHCEAGMSRSPAIAAAIARTLGQSDRRFFNEYQPNMHVYRLMLETASKFSDKSFPGKI